MERVTASLGVRPSTRLTLSGRCAHLGANGSDFHHRGGTLGNESESVKEVENGNDCERLSHEDVPSKKMLRSKEQGCANESVSVRLNVNEGGVPELGNESVTD